MKHRAALVAVAVIAVVAVIAISTGEVSRIIDTFAPQSGSKSASAPKPICSQAIVPTGADCIPQHMAGLPPDPGEAGKATIDGIDADKDGLRDDVQRFIHEQWPDSERTRRALYSIARTVQHEVHHGGDISKEEARKIVPELMRGVMCYGRLQNIEQLRMQSAMEMVENKVKNTPERWARAKDFDFLLAHNVYESPDDSDIPALCGFDPASLPN